MPRDPNLPFAALLTVPLFLLLPALIATLTVVRRAQTAIGRAIAVERPDLWLRRALLAGPQAAVLAILLLRGDLPQEPVVECLMLGILLAWLTPGFHDAILGDAGVQRGWIARRFEDLEEWRLAGEHLRFRLDGEWTSVPCPPSEQPRIREALLSVNSARESRFQD